MLILAADTSLPLFSVALLRDGATVASVAMEGRMSRNEKLLPAVDWLLAESGVARQSIDLFAVTRGPGSFTGVRIGLATIQGLALALGRPVCAMSTHEAVALGGTAAPAVTVVDDAGRGELYVTRFDGGLETVPSRLAGKNDLGELEAGSVRVTIATFLEQQNVAVGCARRADAIAAAGMLEGYADATPIYVRLAEADVKLQQKNRG